MLFSFHLKFHLNIYTAPAYFSAITALINLLLFLFAFKDVRVVSVQRKSISTSTSNSSDYAIEIFFFSFDIYIFRRIRGWQERSIVGYCLLPLYIFCRLFNLHQLRNVGIVFALSVARSPWFSIVRIASPLSIDMYAWSKEQSTAYNGYILGALGCISVVVLIITKILAKR